MNEATPPHEVLHPPVPPRTGQALGETADRGAEVVRPIEAEPTKVTPPERDPITAPDTRGRPSNGDTTAVTPPSAPPSPVPAASQGSGQNKAPQPVTPPSSPAPAPPPSPPKPAASAYTSPPPPKPSAPPNASSQAVAPSKIPEIVPDPPRKKDEDADTTAAHRQSGMPVKAGDETPARSSDSTPNTAPTKDANKTPPTTETPLEPTAGKTANDMEPAQLDTPDAKLSDSRADEVAQRNTDITDRKSDDETASDTKMTDALAAEGYVVDEKQAANLNEITSTKLNERPGAVWRVLDLVDKLVFGNQPELAPGHMGYWETSKDGKAQWINVMYAHQAEGVRRVNRRDIEATRAHIAQIMMDTAIGAPNGPLPISLSINQFRVEIMDMGFSRQDATNIFNAIIRTQEPSIDPGAATASPDSIIRWTENSGWRVITRVLLSNPDIELHNVGPLRRIALRALIARYRLR